jgi:ABC-2 type transport system ATP-binding protein
VASPGSSGKGDEYDMIAVNCLTRKFGDFVALDNVSFEVAAGEIFAFLGPNGAGKTTTIKILTTLLAATSGTVTVDGIDPAREPNEVRKRIGIVFQDPSLDQNLTAWESLELHGVLYGMPKRLRRERMRAFLQAFDLFDRRDQMVNGFSGGLIRRLEIARGMMHTPRVLFLDEPTLGLDPQSRNQLWSYVQMLNRSEGVTVFLTTHYMEEAERFAARVAVIERGKIAALGSPRALKDRTGTASLEDAFLALTGTTIREGAVGAEELMQRIARTRLTR